MRNPFISPNFPSNVALNDTLVLPIRVNIHICTCIARGYTKRGCFEIESHKMNFLSLLLDKAKINAARSYINDETKTVERS